MGWGWPNLSTALISREESGMVKFSSPKRASHRTHLRRPLMVLRSVRIDEVLQDSSFLSLTGRLVLGVEKEEDANHREGPSGNRLCAN